MRIMVYDAARRKAIATGYGLMSAQLSARLATMNNEVFFYDETPNAEVDIWLWIRPPHYVEYKQFDQKNKNVFFTMHEMNTFEGWKANWPTLLNKCTAVITPTQWNKEVFANAGVTKPIYVVPLGVDTKKYHGSKTYEFSLLSVHESFGKDASRENWKENVEAYYAAFYGSRSTEVSYTVKSWNVDMDGFRKFETGLINDNHYDRAELPRIDIIDMELVVQDMNNLYGKSWAFLKNSQREGWCLPAIEALACGVRIIAFPIPSMPYLNNENTDFFQDKKILQEAILKNYNEWRKQKLAINAWSWQNATKKLNIVLGEILVDK